MSGIRTHNVSGDRHMFGQGKQKDVYLTNCKILAVGQGKLTKTKTKTFITLTVQGRIQDFKLGGAHLKKLCRAEGGAKFFWVFRVKNHDFTPKNHIFSNFRGGGGAPGAPPPPPWIRPCSIHCYKRQTLKYTIHNDELNEGNTYT